MILGPSDVIGGRHVVVWKMDAADAAHIVKCVNAHDELVAALQEIERGSVNRRPGHVDAEHNRTKEQIGEIARAILARVQA